MRSRQLSWLPQPITGTFLLPLFTRVRRRGPTASLRRNDLLNSAHRAPIEERKGYKDAQNTAKGTQTDCSTEEVPRTYPKWVSSFYPNWVISSQRVCALIPTRWGMGSA